MYPTLKVELNLAGKNSIRWILLGNEVTCWRSTKEHWAENTVVKRFDTAADAFRYVIDQVIAYRQPENENEPLPFWKPDYHGLARE